MQTITPKNKRPGRAKKIILSLAGGLVLFGILGLSALEILSRTCPVKEITYPNCVTLIKSYVTDPDWWGMLTAIQGQEPLDEELDTIITTRVFVVDRAEIAGINGIACYRYAFVADDLPASAMRYVKTHEALHLMGSYNETETNWQATRREPWGMVQTVGYTVGRGLKNGTITQLPCRLGSMWRTFKVYFINR